MNIVRRIVPLLGLLALLAAPGFAQVKNGSIWSRPGYNSGTVSIAVQYDASTNTATVTFTDSEGTSNPVEATPCEGGWGVTSSSKATTFKLGGPNGGTYRVKDEIKEGVYNVEEKVNGNWRDCKLKLNPPENPGGGVGTLPQV